MQQIWTNPSLERSFIQINNYKSELLNYLKITNTFNSNEILVFENMEYQFSFYDQDTGSINNLKGLVTNLYEDQIKIKYIPNSTDCNKCNKRDECSSINTTTSSNNSPMPTCGCILNPPDTSKYDSPKVYFIPIQNIINISYIGSSSNQNDNTNKGGIRVMLLGISASIVKAVVINLDFFDDASKNPFKSIELKKDKIYDITYEDKDETIYESRAKIISIEDSVDTDCQCGKGIVRENVGMCNSVYTNNVHTKDSFLREPPVRKIRIIVDTSEDFNGHLECIMLDSIRDCKLVSIDDDIDDETISEDTSVYDPCTNCQYKTLTCNKSTCSHCIPVTNNECCPQTTVPEYVYSYDLGEGNYGKVVVNGDMATVNVKGCSTNISLNEVFKYYLGAE